MSGPLAILFEDPHLLVVAKAPGRATQGAGDAVEEAVRRYLAPDDPDSAYLGTVHRLDKPVSGVLLWAKTPKAARRLAGQFAGRDTRKEYWALIDGNISGPTIWEDWLCAEDTGLGRVQVCKAGTPRSRQATTRVENGVGAALPEGISWLILRPETGRTHQLRVQAASRVGPVVGDALYGSTRPFPDGIALHARSLTIEHPSEHRPLTFEAPLPDAWSAFGFGAPPSV